VQVTARNAEQRSGELTASYRSFVVLMWAQNYGWKGREGKVEFFAWAGLRSVSGCLLSVMIGKAEVCGSSIEASDCLFWLHGREMPISCQRDLGRLHASHPITTMRQLPFEYRPELAINTTAVRLSNLRSNCCRDDDARGESFLPFQLAAEE
jgi:hypothetical protein